MMSVEGGERDPEPLEGRLVAGPAALSCFEMEASF